MRESILTITEQKEAAESVYALSLRGDLSSVKAPGEFINIALDGFFLRRPISISDLRMEADGVNGTVTILYKVVGKGTKKLSEMVIGEKLNVLTGLGNGFDTTSSGNTPLVIGGGIGCAPMLMLAKKLLSEGKKVTAAFGFNSAADMILKDEMEALGDGLRLIIATADGSYGKAGLITDVIRDMDYSYHYVCGPTPMLKAVYSAAKGNGEYSFEARMGCGFGACVGCSMETANGVKRVCKDGPVFKKEELLWKD